MIRKGQVKGVKKGDILAQVEPIKHPFGIACGGQITYPSLIVKLSRMIAHQTRLQNRACDFHRTRLLNNVAFVIVPTAGVFYHGRF